MIAIADVSTLVRRPPSLVHWTHRLRDGSLVELRALLPADGPLERAFLARLSPAASRLRFLGEFDRPAPDGTPLPLQRAAVRPAAFVAVAHTAGERRAVGIARLSPDRDDRTIACTVTVDEAWRARGLATLMMDQLVGVARQRGVATLCSRDALADAAMRELATDLGFERRHDPDDATQAVHRLALRR